MNDEMTIEYLPVKQLHEYSRNAKKHPEEQVGHIANSIREFGFRQPLVIDKDNVLVIGHGRLLAAKSPVQDSIIGYKYNVQLSQRARRRVHDFCFRPH